MTETTKATLEKRKAALKTTDPRNPVEHIEKLKTENLAKIEALKESTQKLCKELGEACEAIANYVKYAASPHDREIITDALGELHEAISGRHGMKAEYLKEIPSRWRKWAFSSLASGPSSGPFANSGLEDKLSKPFAR